MKAKDVMEPIKDYLRPDETLRDAVRKMRVTTRGNGLVGVKGMVVLDQDGNLVGMLSIKDVLKTVIPPYMQLSELGEFTWDGMLEEMAKKVAGKKIEEVMTKEVITVEEDASLMEVADLMVKKGLQRVPVVNKEGKVVGMVYVRDLYHTIVDAMFGKEVQ